MERKGYVTSPPFATSERKHQSDSLGMPVTSSLLPIERWVERYVEETRAFLVERSLSPDKPRSTASSRARIERD